MNERIKEFAEQAEQYADDTMNADPATYDKAGQVKVWRELMQAKFAELIVQECMNICAEREEDIRTRIKDEGKAATAYMIRAYIKEHFGVEE